MNRLYILLIIGIIFSGGCFNVTRTDSDAEIESITTGLKKANLNITKSWMVILPGLGCNGCIQEGEAFMSDYVDSTNIFFVLTKVQSLKILQLKIGKNINNRSNIFVDNDGIFNIPTKNSIYPCIVQMKDGKIVKHQFQCPANSQAFEWLKTQVD